MIGSYLRWVGGKTQLASELIRRLPEKFERYLEPFCGSAALFFCYYGSLRNYDMFSTQDAVPALLNDSNEALINCHQCIANRPIAVWPHINSLAAEHAADPEGVYYRIRKTFNRMDGDSFRKAAEFIYINKTCFNGLWRVNSSGDFNVPSNGSKRFRISWLALQRCWLLFRDHATLSCGGYAEFLWSKVRKGDFVFLDPPYIPLSTTSSFTSYTQDGWTDRDNLQLADILSQLDSIGVKFLMTNSSSPLVYELFGKWNIQEVKAHRFVKALSGSGGKRDKVEETVITNY